MLVTTMYGDQENDELSQDRCTSVRFVMHVSGSAVLNFIWCLNLNLVKSHPGTVTYISRHPSCSVVAPLSSQSSPITHRPPSQADSHVRPRANSRTHEIPCFERVSTGDLVHARFGMARWVVKLALRRRGRKGKGPRWFPPLGYQMSSNVVHALLRGEHERRSFSHVPSSPVAWLSTNVIFPQTTFLILASEDDTFWSPAVSTREYSQTTFSSYGWFQRDTQSSFITLSAVINNLFFFGSVLKFISDSNIVRVCTHPIARN